MKKLTTLFILIFISSFIFAKPKIPKIDNYYKTWEIDFTGQNYLTYMSNSGLNFYRIFAVVNPDKKIYSLYFINTSCITDVDIILQTDFSNENNLDKFIEKIDTYDLEKSFINLRNEYLRKEIKPDYDYSVDFEIRTITYLSKE